MERVFGEASIHGAGAAVSEADDQQEPSEVVGSELRGKARRAGFWALGGQVVKALIQVATVVVLARLLTADDYGLFGMVMAFTALAGIFREFGLSGAAIQAADLSAAQRSNLWWLNVLAGAALTLLGLVTAPLVALAFAEPRLTPYMVGIAGTFLLSSAGTQYGASLQRELRYKELQIIGISSQVVALGACIIAALSGWGTWALILQSYVSTGLSLIMLVTFCRWIPTRWDRTAPMRGFLRFGTAMLGYNLISYMGNYVVNFATGRYFGSQELGSLTRGNQLVTTPVSFLSQPVSQLAFASLSRVQRDIPRLQRHGMLWQQAAAYPVALLCGALIVVGPSLVPIALGDGWARSVGFVQLIALATALGYVPMAAGWLYQCQGRPEVQLRISLVFTPVRVLAVLVAAQYSVEAVLWTNVAISMITWPVSYLVLGRTTAISSRPLMMGVLRVLLVAGAPAAALLLLRQRLGAPASSVLDLIVYGLSYVALCGAVLVVPTVRREVFDVIRVVKGR